MPKQALGLSKHTMNFYEGDFDRIRSIWPDEEPSVIIREFVHEMIEKHEAAAQVEMPEIEVVLK